MLSLLSRYAWHVGGFPCEDVPIGAEEGGEREFLCGVEVALLDFPTNTTHEMCCNMPYLVAIAAIATNLFRKKTQLYVSLH